MAAEPDPPEPTPVPPVDPEMDAEHYRKGNSIGDLRSTRLGLPSWASVVVLLAVFLAFLWLTC